PGGVVELGRYRLEEQVGQGGMAVVWRGWDTQLRRTVAVKVLHAHLHSREDIRKRFDREAHAVARLHHPYILDVYDFSGPQAQPSYLVTEFIRGQTLRAFADEHPFDPPELAAACLLPIAEALQHAHAKIISRLLENEPAKRYQSAAEVKLELTQLLREAGIDDPVRELAAFVRAPQAHAADVRARLVARTLDVGEEHLSQKRTSAALAAFGRALSLDPGNARARGRVDRIRRRERLFRLARRAMVAMVALAVAGAAGWELRVAIQRARAKAAEKRVAEEKLAAERSAREKLDARSRTVPPAAPPTVSAVVPTSENNRQRTAPPPAKPAEVLDVKLHVRQHAQVTVDDRDLGDSTLSIELKAGWVNKLDYAQGTP